MENPIECMKQACARMESYVSTVAGYMATTLRYLTSANLARDAAAASADIAATAAAEASSVVIPTEATYSKDEIDEQEAAQWRKIWANKADILNLKIYDLN